tara:strand:- start:79639 stop:82980 length:3342 start_codon:yes stop_codon:yes gene_type:complete
MLANELIDRIERLGLLDQEIIEALREQLESGGTRITPEAVAKLLVDNGQLTRFQATKLIGELRSGENDLPGESPLGAAASEDVIDLADEGLDSTEAFVEAEPVDDVFAEPVQVETTADSASMMDVGSVDSSTEGRPQRKRPKPIENKSVWDSFKIYGFLGIIAMLLLAGGGLYWVLSRGNEDDLIIGANKLYEQQNYTNAQERYLSFLESFPDGQYASLARTRVAMTQLYRAEEMSDPTRALALAQELLPKIEEETGLNEERGNLAALLVDIAQNIADAAGEAKETEEKKRLLGKLDEQIELTNNPNYVASSMRPTLAGPLSQVTEDRQRVQREINRNERLDESVAAMTAALQAKKTKESYDIRFDLLRDFPELSNDQRLVSLIQQASEIQQTLVIPSAKLPKVEQGASDNDAMRSIVLVTNDGRGAPGLRDETLYLRARGSVLAFDGESGTLKWRKFVGYDHAHEPIRLNGGSGVLLTESLTSEVQRRDSADGTVRWRVVIGEPFRAPIAVRDDIYVAADSGRLISLDSETGDPKWVQQFPQSLVVGPGVDVNNSRAYIPGDHSNIYVLNSRDGSCVESYYLGHNKGAVAVAPVPLLGHVFVIENAGVDFALVHVLEVDENGEGLKPAQPPFRLDGNVHVAPKLQDRRIIILTDRGQVVVYDIEPTAKKREQVTTAATQPATYDEPTATRMAIGKSQMWVSGTRIGRYELQINTGRVVPDWVKYPGDTFIGEPYANRDALVHARVLRGTSGIRVAAVDPETSEVFWQTDVGVPVSMLVPAPEGKGVHAVTSQGTLYELDRDALQTGSSKGPIENPGGKGIAMRFEDPLVVDEQRRLMLNQATKGQILVYDPSRKSQKLRLITLLLPGGKQAGGAIVSGGGLFLPLDSGRATLMNFQTGAVAGSPFQPASDPTGTVSWSQPVTLPDDADQIVIADSRKQIYRLRIGEQLRELAQSKLDYDLLGPSAAVNNTFVATTSGPASDYVVGFDMVGLKESFKTLLDGRVTWGPVSVADVCLMQTDDSVLRAFADDGKQKFQVQLPAGSPIGQPLMIENNIVLCGRTGWVVAIDATSGALLGTTNIGQPISATPLNIGPKLLVPGGEGVIYLVEVPANG